MYIVYINFCLSFNLYVCPPPHLSRSMATLRGNSVIVTSIKDILEYIKGNASRILF